MGWALITQAVRRVLRPARIGVMAVVGALATVALGAEASHPTSEYVRSIKTIERIGYHPVRPHYVHLREFKELAVQADAHVEDALAFLDDPAYPDEEKRIVIYSMYRQPLLAYCQFANRVIDLYESARIDRYLLIDVIYMGRYRNTLIENYRDESVRTLIKRLYALSSTDRDLITIADDILTGQAWDWWRDWAKVNQIPDPD